MIITRRYYFHNYQGKGCMIDIRTDSRVSELQARTNATELAHRKLKAKSVSVELLDIDPTCKPDYSIGPKVPASQLKTDTTFCQRHKHSEPCPVCDWQPKRDKTKPYTVKKKNGKFWVMTPSGKAIAVAHRTKADANMAANVLNHMNRDESTVVTVEQRRARNLRKPIFIVVQGGVAEVVDSTVPKGFEVEVIDYDNLKEGGADELAKLSAQARAFVKANQ